MKHSCTWKVVILAFPLFLIAEGAIAGIVYGTVRGPDINGSLPITVYSNNVPSDVIPNAVRANGTYRLFLPRGSYKVGICSGGRRWTGLLLVGRKSLQQDLNLSRTNQEC